MATGGKLENLTQPTAVEKAMEEFRVLGRDAFIEKYGFRRSRDFFVVHKDAPTTASPWRLPRMATSLVSNRSNRTISRVANP